jgi:hypothetical protein
MKMVTERENHSIWSPWGSRSEGFQPISGSRISEDVDRREQTMSPDEILKIVAQLEKLVPSDRLQNIS